MKKLIASARSSVGSIALFVAMTITAPLLAADTMPSSMPSSMPSVSELPALKIEGNTITANGQPIRLRGLDWGWWHLQGTRYSEADMANVAQWGANVIRLSFSYNDLETDDNPTAWKENGFKDLDEVVQWAKRCGVYVILDMHVVPGGQSDAPYCAGGRNLLWTDTSSQDRFANLWVEIARRYHNRPEVAAYDLINEPSAPPKKPGILEGIDQRVITAIRTVDPDKIIAVGGDFGSGPEQLTDAMKFADNNILYTFHWYVGAGGNEDWISTDRMTPGMNGAQDWTKIEKTFTAPPGADHMSAIFRSVWNKGSAWFDDIQVTDASGNVLQSDSFDKDKQDFHPEAQAETMSYDAGVGHDKPGSLKVHASTIFNDWAGWADKRISVEPGKQYHVSGWVKLDQSTGDTYLGAMFLRDNTQIDQAAFQKRIAPAVEFSKKFNVPLWVGEFGCDTSNPEMQVQWVNACTALFEQNQMNWTYWNDKETSDPKGMGVQAEHADGSDYPVNEKLLNALRSGWSLNAKAPQ